MDAAPPACEASEATVMARSLYLSLGLLCVILGIIGAILPLMPTTIFLIIAAYCFGRSSERLQSWLHRHPRFGPPILDWEREGAISRKGKVAACSGMALGFVIFHYTANPALWLDLLVALMMLGCALYVTSRPAPISERKGS